MGMDITQRGQVAPLKLILPQTFFSSAKEANIIF
jgi:hypothetical protein